MRNKETVRIYHECDGCCCLKTWWSLGRCILKGKYAEFLPGKMNFDGVDGSTSLSDIV